MKLTTEIINIRTGERFAACAIPGPKTLFNCGGNRQANIFVINNDGSHSQVGFLIYSEKGDHIHLEYIRNQSSQYKHVGTAGIEYLLRIPGVNKITTDASYSSHVFHWKLGFRYSAVSAAQIPGIYDGIAQLYRKLLKAYEEKDEAKMLAIGKSIVLHEEFDSVLSDAAYFANKSNEIARREGRVPNLNEMAVANLRKKDLCDEQTHELKKEFLGLFMQVMRAGIYQDRNISKASDIYLLMDMHCLWADYKKYCDTQDPQEKEKLRQLIRNNPTFETAREWAQSHMGDDCNYKEVIILDPDKDFDTIMQKSDKRSEASKSSNRIDTSNWGGMLWELPEESIKALKLKFEINDPAIDDDNNQSVSTSSTSSTSTATAAPALQVEEEDDLQQFTS